MSKNDKQHALVPRLRFPEFLDDAAWQNKRLKQLFDERTDKGGEELPLLSLTDAEGLIHQKDSGRKDNSNADKSRYARVHPGDIAYNTMRMWEGRSALACEAGLVSPAYTVCIPKGNVDSRFFAYYFKTAQVIEQFRRFSQGLVKDTLSLKFDRFAEIQLPTTSLPEQQKIADCLGSLDDLIAAEGRKLAALRDHKKGLMQQLFPREGETRPRFRFPEFRDAGEWDPRPIEQICEILNNRRVPITSSDRVPGPYPYYGASGVVDYVNDYIFDERLVLVGEDGAKWKAFEPTAFIAEGRYWVNNHAHVLKPIGLIDTLLANYLTLLDVGGYVTGAAPPKLTLQKLKAIPIPVPPSDGEQQRIADCLASLDAVITAQAEKLDALRTHKRGLMQQLFPSPKEAEA